MRFSTAIIVSILAGSALASPSPRLQQRKSPVRLSNTTTTFASSDNWSGVVIDTPSFDSSFEKVTGKITVPTPSVPIGIAGPFFAGSAWVGIGGYKRTDSLLQTGVIFDVALDGSVSFLTWYEWFPEHAYFSGLHVSAGDVLSMTVGVSTTDRKIGHTELINETTGKSIAATINSTTPLEGNNAEWIIEDFKQNGSRVPLADFGTITFTDCFATASGSDVATFEDHHIMGIKSNVSANSGKYLTSTTILSPTEVKIDYVPPF